MALTLRYMALLALTVPLVCLLARVVCLRGCSVSGRYGPRRSQPPAAASARCVSS